MKTIDVVAAAILDSQRVLIFRRGPDQKGAGEWEFPGGKVEVGETFEEALHREIKEELSVGLLIQNFVGASLHRFEDKQIHLHLFLCAFAEGFSDAKIQLVDHDAKKWVAVEELLETQLSLPDRPFVEQIKKIVQSKK